MTGFRIPGAPDLGPLVRAVDDLSETPQRHEGLPAGVIAAIGSVAVEMYRVTEGCTYTDQLTLPQRFTLERHIDETGISGTGTVASGIEWPDGTVALRWHSQSNPCPPSSTAVYASIDDVIAIHGHGGKTSVRWIDGTNGVAR